jgi:hypothetical protein
MAYVNFKIKTPEPSNLCELRASLNPVHMIYRIEWYRSSWNVYVRSGNVCAQKEVSACPLNVQRVNSRHSKSRALPSRRPPCLQCMSGDKVGHHIPACDLSPRDIESTLTRFAVRAH